MERWRLTENGSGERETERKDGREREKIRWNKRPNPLPHLTFLPPSSTSHLPVSLSPAMASTARALALSFKPLLHPPPSSPTILPLFSLPTSTSPAAALTSKRSSPGIVCCLVSGVDGGGTSDTRNSEFSRGFAVIANMLKRIEPFDVSVISKGVSESAKYSMKQTISTMLGLLPSDQFSVSVRVSKLPTYHLLFSSIMTGYTLWNAEYRISLMRNYDLSSESTRSSELSPRCLEDGDDLDLEQWFEEMLGGDGKPSGDSACQSGGGGGDSSGGCLKDLSQKTSNYIRQLEDELSAATKELDAEQQYYLQAESNRGSSNNLLEYLRSLESYMVSELSRPSSREVTEVVDQLSRNIMQRFYQDSGEQNGTAAPVQVAVAGDLRDSDNETRKVITTSRDYLAKLLFWCMLLGHHLRGLENRLHLSCAVGLL